jgi:hypothetical protein
MLSVSRLCGVHAGTIKKHGAVGGTRIGKGKQIIRRNPDTVPLRAPKSHMTWLGI